MGRASCSPHLSWLPMETGMALSLPDLREHLDTALRHRVCTVRGPEWSWELDLTILLGPFPPEILCSSTFLLSSVPYLQLLFLPWNGEPQHPPALLLFISLQTHLDSTFPVLVPQLREGNYSCSFCIQKRWIHTNTVALHAEPTLAMSSGVHFNSNMNSVNKGFS